jgi:hypothetical protein
MNELEFRKRCIINPDDPDPAFRAALENAGYRRLQEECAGFDEQLSAALNVPAPEGLQERILAANRRPSFLARWKKRLAALTSLIVTMVLGLTLLLRPQLALSDMVIEHLYHDMEVMYSRDVVRDEQVDEIVQHFGAAIESSLVGIIRFIEDCRFSDYRKGIHLVYDGQSGPVTVFYIPHRRIDRMQAIGKNEFQGIMFPHHDGTMAIVGLIGEDLKSQRSRVEAAFSWNDTSRRG